MNRILYIFFLITFTRLTCNAQHPLPSTSQMKWHEAELGVLFSYDLHVFDNMRYNQHNNRINPVEDYQILNPQRLDKEPNKHRFSMTCKVDCLNEQFITEEGRQEALDFFKSLRIEMVYLESYRHGVSVPSGILEKVKDTFEKEGLQCAGLITPTMMSLTKSTGWDAVTCFTDPAGLDSLKQVVERTAKIFDLIIMDDFLFMSCECERCTTVKGNRSWEQFRREYMLNVSKQYVLQPAKEVNPQCKIIIKYPCWHEGLQDSGYDVVHQTVLFDYSFAGTETRINSPQTQACWYQAWLNDISMGKCAGGWYDPLSCTPEIYVEQARQTILGGAKESLLHCYDYLGTDRPGIALDADAGVKTGRACAMAIQKEIDGLQRLADLITHMQPIGVLLPKKPNEKPSTPDLNMLPRIGMLGIPFIASGMLKENDAYFLTAHASNFDNLNTTVQKCIQENKPVILSKQVYQDLDGATKKQLGNHPELPDNSFLMRTANGQFLETGDLFQISEDQINEFRNHTLQPFGMQMEAPKNVSLHLFTSKSGNIEVVENFNDEPVTVKISFLKKQKKNVKMGLPTNDAIKLEKGENEYVIYLESHSLAVIGDY